MKSLKVRGKCGVYTVFTVLYWVVLLLNGAISLLSRFNKQCRILKIA